MNANVSKLLNEQINKEFYSAYLYLDFANYYAAVGLDGGVELLIDLLVEQLRYVSVHDTSPP